MSFDGDGFRKLLKINYNSYLAYWFNDGPYPRRKCLSSFLRKEGFLESYNFINQDATYQDLVMMGPDLQDVIFTFGCEKNGNGDMFLDACFHCYGKYEVCLKNTEITYELNAAAYYIDANYEDAPKYARPSILIYGKNRTIDPLSR